MNRADTISPVQPVRRPSPAIGARRPIELTVGARSLGVNFSWALAGNLAFALARWSMVLVLARLGSTEMAGLAVLALALGTPLWSLASLGLRSGLVTDVAGQYDFRDYLALRIAGCLAALLLLSVFVRLLGYPPEVWRLVMLVGVGKAVESLSDIFHGLLQREERMDRVGLALVLREPLAVLLLASGLILTGDVTVAMLGFPVAMAVALLSCDIPSAARLLDGQGGGLSRLWPRWRPRILIRLAWTSAPLGMLLMLVALASNLPRYLIERILDPEALGLFMVIGCLSIAQTRLVTPLVQSAAPRLARYWSGGRRAEFARLMFGMELAIGIAGLTHLFLVSLAAPWLIGLVCGPAYAPHARLAVWLAAAGTVADLCLPMARAVEAGRRFWTHLGLRAASLLAMAALLPLGIGCAGLEGAAAAMLACGVFSLALYLGVLLGAGAGTGRPAMTCQ